MSQNNRKHAFLPTDYYFQGTFIHKHFKHYQLDTIKSICFLLSITTNNTILMMFIANIITKMITLIITVALYFNKK